MNLNNLIPLPTREEYKTVKRLAESIPEELDDREIWILSNFGEEDFQ